MSWLNQALVGVDRPASFPDQGGASELLAQMARGQDDPALTFSRAAGVLAACRLAALSLSNDVVAPPAPAAADLHPLTQDHPWAAALAWVFAEGPLRLQYEACRRMAAVDRTLPVQLLPRALDAGKRSLALRAVLRGACGQRGRWLAQFNPDWSYAANGAAEIEAADDLKGWEEGDLAQRVAYLQRRRAQDPAAARELLQAQLTEQSAKERTELVAMLEHGLGDADEGLLNTLLKDRSREVRYLAAKLLTKLPQAAHTQRLLGWLAPLLSQKRGLFRKSWTIDAPEQIDPAWAAAMVDGNRPQHEALGERAWWLYQLVRQAPLSWWTAHTGMAAGELIAWAADSDWKAALYRGWRERMDASERGWIEAILASRAVEFGRDISGLLALLPVAERERHWPRSLDQLRQNGRLGEVLESCPLGETLSVDFSRALLNDIRACLESNRLRDDYGLRPPLLALAALVHPSALRDWKSPAWPEDTTPAQAEFITEFSRIVAVRQTLHSTLS